MSSTTGAETATLIAAGIGVLGALGGVVVERLLRFLGRTWCEPADYDVSPRSGDAWEGIKTETDPEATEWIDYSVRLDLYNSREVPTGLRNVRVVFECSDGCLSKVPNDKAELLRRPTSGGPPEPQMYAPLYVVNLPPRQWVVKEITGRLHDPEEIRRAFDWRQIEFAGERRRVWPLPPKKLRWVVATRP